MVNEDNIYGAFCDRIFELLEEKNLSQKELAKRLGVSPQTITDWKKGKSQSFSSMIGRLADVLDTTPKWLFCGEGRRNMSKEEKEIIEELKLDILESGPSVEKVQLLAQYLGVTTSQLLGEDGPGNLAIQDQPYLVMRYNSLPPKVQEEVMAFIEFKVAQQTEKK